jgi:hypothetical protein
MSDMPIRNNDLHYLHHHIYTLYIVMQKSMYIVDLLPSLTVLSKVDRKILVLFGLIRNFKIWDLAMAKVKKVNIAVTKYIAVKKRH